MKKIIRFITSLVILSMSVLMCSSMTPVGNRQYTEPLFIDMSEKFEDVALTKWYKEAVDYAVAYSMFEGTSDSSFEPEAAMNRAMFVTVIARLEGAEINNNITGGFADVPSDKWYTGAVSWAYTNGIVTGVTKTAFEPMSAITREQMCTMLVRYAEKKGITLNQTVEKITFADDGKIKSYAKDAVYKCQMSGLVNGITPTTFEPASTATRAQVAKILMEFHKDCIFERSTYLPSVDAETAETETAPEDVWENSARRANECSIFNLDQNPILAKDRKANTEILPSFNIDETVFVRAGTKLIQLNGKTLTFFTADNTPQFYYRAELGEVIDEWEWFKLLQAELGLNIKFTVKTGERSLTSAIQYMNAGKSLDLLCVKDEFFLEALNVSDDISQYVNINNLDSAPGVSYVNMKNTAWRNSYRVISPSVSGDVLWYNETLVTELGLSDPHTLWQNGNWTPNEFKRFFSLVPESNSKGQPLTAFVQDDKLSAASWSHVYGGCIFEIDNTKKRDAVASLFGNEKTLKSWQIFRDVFDGVSYSNTALDYDGLLGGTTLMSNTAKPIGAESLDSVERYGKLNWAPYPDEEGDGYASFTGVGMMLPRKTVNLDNILYALKFAQLWATRYTEAVMDNLATLKSYQFDSKQLAEFYSYMTGKGTAELTNKNVKYSSIIPESIGDMTDFYSCFLNVPLYDIKTEAEKAEKTVSRYAIDILSRN